MDEGWYYHDGANAVGPITFDALAKYLRARSDPGNVKVWHLRLQDWQSAKDVPQITESNRPPPLNTVQAEQPPAPSRNPQPPKTNADGPKARFAFIIASVLVLWGLVVLNSVIYVNPVEGGAYLFGQFVGAAGILSLIGVAFWSCRPYRTGTVVIGIAALSLLPSHIEDISKSFATHEAKAALKNAGDLETAVKTNPSNIVLQLIDVGLKAATETNRSVEKSFNEIEPPGLASEPNYESATL